MDTFSFISKLLILFTVTTAVKCKVDMEIKYLEPGDKVMHTPKKNLGFHKTSVEIYCYRGRPKYLVNIFTSITLLLDGNDDDFNQYEGVDPDTVIAAYDDHRSIFSFNFFASKKKQLKLDPFNQTCIGIESASPYAVYLHILRLDYWKFLVFVFGVAVFFTAPTLAENPIFYYLTGILLGISASLLIVIYMVSKLIPRKPMMYGAMLGGWTLTFYFGQLVFDNIRVILVTHQMYVFWYVFASGLISFVVCYRMGPPQNPRSKNLIRWGLQAVASLLVFYSSHFQEATVGAILLMCLIKYFPQSVISKGKTMWCRRFPPKRRLLTSEEFYEEGVRETTKALQELRQYCSSPESKPWRTMLKLKDASRFASFIEGDSHLRDDEILDYETTRYDVSDNGSDISDDEEEAPPAPRTNNFNLNTAEISEDEEEAEDQQVPPPPGWTYDRFERNLPRNGTLRSTPTQILTRQRTPQRNSTPPVQLNGSTRGRSTRKNT